MVDHVNGRCTDEKQATAPIGRCHLEAFALDEWLHLPTEHSQHVLAEENEERIKRARCATIGNEEFGTKDGLHHCDSHAGFGKGLKAS